jgi:hypothetical protein
VTVAETLLPYFGQIQTLKASLAFWRVSNHMKVFDRQSAMEWAKSWRFFADGRQLNMLRLTIDAMHGNYLVCKHTSPSRADGFLAAFDYLSALVARVKMPVSKQAEHSHWYTF